MVDDDPPQRPALEPAMSAAEFRRWYWLKAELIEFARRLGVPTSGGKERLATVIAVALGEVEAAGLESPMTSSGHSRASAQLAAPLTVETVIPAGQRCSEVVRAWMLGQVGPGFHFDAAMRSFFASVSGEQTLADAVACWHATRDAGPGPIEGQFELNRFTRAWHAEHPDGTREQLLDAWRVYRSLPVDARGRA